MLKKMKTILTSNRMKSLYWRTSMMVLAVVVGNLLSNIDMFAPVLGATGITMLGLILGEVSKALNNAYSRK